MSVTAVLSGPEAASAAQIDCAIALTKKLNTSLKGLSVMPDPATTVMYFATSEAIMAGAPGISAVAEAQMESLERVRARFEDAVAGHRGLRAGFESYSGQPQAYCANEASLSDALVFPRGVAGSDHALNPAFEHVLMTARLPLVVASGDGRADGPALIAWDGSPQAARAVRFHLPLLRAFEQVIIAHHPDKVRAEAKLGPAASPEALAGWLSGEGIKATTESFTGAVGEGLLSLAKSHGSDLIVMGAYGHSRLGEMLFGGTSRALLNAAEGPALALAH